MKKTLTTKKPNINEKIDTKYETLNEMTYEENSN